MIDHQGSTPANTNTNPAGNPTPDTPVSALSTLYARPKKNQVYGSLQVMRGIAALLVVVHHAVLIMGQPEYGALHASFAPPPIGWIGVNFFFVLSGFIILHAHVNDIGKPNRLLLYVWRRFSRVYPIYWIVLTAFIGAAYLGLGYPEFSKSVKNIATAYFLVQFESLPSLPLKVAWTLLYEIQFYAIFALAIFNRKCGAIALTIWFAAIIISSFRHHAMNDGFPHIWSINFFIGGFIYWCTKQNLAVSGKVMLLGGVTMLITLYTVGLIPDGPFSAQNAPVAMLLIGVAFGTVLLGGVVIERAQMVTFPPLILLVGDASYAIYLVHSAVISLAMSVHRRFALNIDPDALVLLLIVGSTTAGVLAHIIMERPLLARLKSIGPKR